MAIIDLVTMITDEKIKFLVAGGENFGIGDTKDDSKKDATDAEVVEVEETDEKEEKK